MSFPARFPVADLVSGTQLLHNLRDHEQAVGPGGRVAEGVVVRERGADFVGASHIHARRGVGGRLDVGYVQFLEFLDVFENVPELFAELLFLFRREREPRQMRDIFDINLTC